MQTVYLLKKEPQVGRGELAVLQAATVKVGASDGSSVEVIEGLKEGDVVVSGTVSAIVTASPAASPFGGKIESLPALRSRYFARSSLR